MSDMNCPYCNAEQEVCHDDGHGYAEEVKHEHRCRECDKLFVFQTYISMSYEAAPAECLNDGAHDFQPTTCTPKWATRMRCRMCDEERQPTATEKATHGIPDRPAQQTQGERDA